MSWLGLGKGANSMFLTRLGTKVMAKNGLVSGPECCRGSWMVIESRLAQSKMRHSCQATGYHYWRLEVEVYILVQEGFGRAEEWAFLVRQPSAGVQSRTRRNRSTLARTEPPVARSAS